jgi:hypothetical protein
LAYVVSPAPERGAASKATLRRLIAMTVVGVALLAETREAFGSVTICVGDCDITPTPPPPPLVCCALPIALLLEGDNYFAFSNNANLAATNTFGVAGIAGRVDELVDRAELDQRDERGRL